MQSQQYLIYLKEILSEDPVIANPSPAKSNGTQTHRTKVVAALEASFVNSNRPLRKRKLNKIEN